MFLAIIVLVVLILVTPSLMGHPPSLAPPIMIIAVTPDKSTLIVDVTAAVQAQLYDSITINLTRLNAANVSVENLSSSQTFTYGVEMRAHLNLTYWRVHVWLEDEQTNYFEYNVTIRAYLDRNNNRLTLAFSFPDDNSSTVVTRVPPDDYRVTIPQRGTVR
jgi:hypothetical protein